MTDKKRLAWLGVAAIGALLLLALFVSSVLAQGPGPGMGRGMMGGWGMMGPGMTGMMSRCGGSPMWGGQCGPWGRPGVSGKRLTGDQVEKTVEDYLNSYYNGPDLRIAEVMEFENNFYAQVAEKSGVNAFELLVDPYTGAVWPEYGPNMMWNTKYGHMGGMMGSMMGGMMQGWRGRGTAQPSADMPVSPSKAKETAQQYLNGWQSGLTAGDPEAFYGYYTLHTLDQDGKIAGMLSVNGYTGQVWYHTWHGKFVDMVTEME